MRSPLELLRGQFEHALLTTYSFNLRFFEEWVLRSLWAAEVRNVVVFVDRSQLGAALLDRAPTLAGRAYHLVSGSCAKHAFHPKLLLVSGREGARLCVSSANLTAAGQLRNAESAIAFDANLAGHRRPILEAGDLFRRLSAEAPPHTAGAIQAALAALPEEEEEEASSYRLLHNLDQRLLDSFPPSGRTRAIAPFVDADGTAARHLHERGELTVIVDGDEIAAAPQFFAAEWSVEARKFDARLHGKAYEVATAGGRWVLVGSPNLSQAALLQPAGAGNLEVAVAVTDGEELELPSGEPWDGGAVADAAADRLAVARAATDSPAPASFDAWEDADRIVVSGVPEGAEIERSSQGQWHPLGTVTDGAVLNPDPNLRPRRLRAVTEDGQVAFAVVTQPATLQARLHTRVEGPQTKAVERLPLDVATVRILEEALAQLYALSELAGEMPASGRRPSTLHRRDSVEEAERLGEWMPRTPEEEPRVPPVYAKGWEGETDALQALVSRVLRLDAAERPGGEIDVKREGLEIDELEEVTGEGDIEIAEEEPPVRVGAEELERYRRAFRRLFERGKDFLSSSLDPTLAGWAFTYLLRLVEDLGSHSVEVDGQRESLMPRAGLRAISLDVLERYLDRGEVDPLCLATARAHLAVAIRDRARYSRRDVERLEALAYKWAAELVSVPVDLPAPSPATIGMDILTAISRLEDYAHRSQWDGVVGQAEGALDGARLRPEPWPLIVGSVAELDRRRSPAWSLLGFAARVGYDTPDPFGVVVENDGASPVAVQALICVPTRKEIIEAWRRRADGVWVERRYGAPTMGTVRRLDGSPMSLSVTMASTELGEILDGSDELLELAARLGLNRTAQEGEKSP